MLVADAIKLPLVPPSPELNVRFARQWCYLGQCKAKGKALVANIKKASFESKTSEVNNKVGREIGNNGSYARRCNPFPGAPCKNPWALGCNEAHATLSECLFFFDLLATFLCMLRRACCCKPN